MPRYRYLHLDVFTRVPFGGSRLTLFPNAEGLSRAQMQAIAREMGVGETAFVSGNVPQDEAWRLRIFTSTGEVPMSGISLLGATCGLEYLGSLAPPRQGGRFCWRTETGTYPVIVSRASGAPVYSVEYPPAEFIGQYYQRAKVARALGLAERDIAITGLPCEIVSIGLPIHIVPVGSLAAVQGVQPSRNGAKELAHDLGFSDLFVFTCETVSDEADVHCRMFAHSFGIPEDAATGSAVGSLLAYMIKHRLVVGREQVRIVLEQGVEMGRPSLLYAEADLADGHIVRTRVGGHCVVLGEGTLVPNTGPSPAPPAAT